MNDLNSRIRQLTKLILTSQTVDENKDNESRPASPTKVDFDMSPYQVSVVEGKSDVEVTLKDYNCAVATRATGCAEAD